MNLDQKQKLSLSYDEAEALKKYLTWVISQPTDNAWVQMMYCLVLRVREKLKTDAYGLIGQPITIKLNLEQSMALQIAIALYAWPGNYIDHALHRAQQQLPPLIYATERPAGIAWDEGKLKE